MNQQEGTIFITNECYIEQFGWMDHNSRIPSRFRYNNLVWDTTLPVSGSSRRFRNRLNAIFAATPVDTKSVRARAAFVNVPFGEPIYKHQDLERPTKRVKQDSLLESMGFNEQQSSHDYEEPICDEFDSSSGQSTSATPLFISNKYMALERRMDASDKKIQRLEGKFLSKSGLAKSANFDRLNEISSERRQTFVVNRVGVDGTVDLISALSSPHFDYIRNMRGDTQWMELVKFLLSKIVAEKCWRKVYSEAFKCSTRSLANPEAVFLGAVHYAAIEDICVILSGYTNDAQAAQRSLFKSAITRTISSQMESMRRGKFKTLIARKRRDPDAGTEDTQQ